jgi:hypothetical protein
MAAELVKVSAGLPNSIYRMKTKILENDGRQKRARHTEKAGCTNIVVEIAEHFRSGEGVCY